jgi:putative membrane protein
MKTLAAALVVLVALLHVLFLVLEMFLWNKPYGRRAFGLTREFAEQSAKLAANQGLYNGFLAAGLIWGLLRGDASIQIFFLVCVVIAGLYGGLTVKRSILVLQALPAGIALALVLLAG